MAEKRILKDLLSFVLIFGCFMICVKGTCIELLAIAIKNLVANSNVGVVILSPRAVAPVCRVGDQLELTCNSTGSFLRWIFTIGNEQGVPQEYRRNINSQDGSQQMSMIEVNSTTFTFMRISDQGVLPLISTLVINSVSSTLNGTVVHCVDVGTSTTASTTVHLIHNMSM